MNSISKQSSDPDLEINKFRPNKRLGQNFLVSRKILQRIIFSADLQKTDRVLEIGPGKGMLTDALKIKAAQVVAYEKDKRLAHFLQQKYANDENVKIYQQDILKLPKLPFKKYKVVANLPYYITSPLIRFFLENINQPQSMTVMVQKEVALRICAQPPKMTILSVAVQLYCQPQIAFFVSKKAFRPQSKVDSAVLRLENISRPDIDAEYFFKVVKAGFSSPRKQMVNNLANNLKLEKDFIVQILKSLQIDPRIRAQSLSLSYWHKLTDLVKEKAAA